MQNKPVNTPEEIVTFWFSPEVMPLWFNSTAQFDARLRDNYLTIYQAAASGQLASWEQSANGALALVIVLDQFPLNMFRNKPESFATEAAAREVAARAIAQGLDKELNDAQKAFLYLPYMHSETLTDQQRSVQLFEQANLHNNLRWARHHRDIIQRFGRFPHRNAILGRRSSDQEIDYLDSESAFKG